MARSSDGSRGEDVVALIARKDFARAIRILKAQLQTPRPDPRVRLQLADVLVASGKARDAVPILLPLADEYAQDGFAAKAISVLKRVQRIDPGRLEVEDRLARLIESRQREATVVAAPAPAFEIGIEEISLDAGAPISFAAPEAGGATGLPFVEIGEAPERRAEAGPVLASPLQALGPARELEEAFEIGGTPLVKPKVTWERSIEAHSDGVDLARDIGAEARVPDAPASGAELAGTAALSGLPDAVGFRDGDLEILPLAEEDSGKAAEPLPFLDAGTLAPEPDGTLDLEDYDLLGLDDIDGAEANELPTLEATALGDEPMSDDRFVDELMALVDGAFGAKAEREAPREVALLRPGQQIVVSPLFKDFSVDEMVAVIAGLNLLTVERGDVIVREGERGDSLYMLTSGEVRAFRRDGGTGKQQKLADLHEGSFFGEVSILTKGPRTATVAALTRCELLELDRSTLDGIVCAHPRVLDVLQQFARERMASRPAAGSS